MPLMKCDSEAMEGGKLRDIYRGNLRPFSLEKGEKCDIRLTFQLRDISV